MTTSTLRLHLDKDGYINEDVDCPDCHYNLRGIHPTGVCPECGKPVANALTALQFSDPTWIFCLAGGLNWINFSIYFSIVFTILAALLQGLFIAQSTSTPAYASSLLLLLPVLAYVWGIWKFTTPEHPENVNVPAVARLLTRYTLLISSALIWIPEFFPASNEPTINPASVSIDQLNKLINVNQFNTMTLFNGSAAAASFVLFMVGTFAGLVYARQIARRIPDKKLARNTTIVMWGCVATGLLILLMIFLGIVSFFMAANQAAPAIAISMIFPGCGSIICVLVFGGWAFVLLSQYRKKLKTVAQRAALRGITPEVYP
jgi:hypothetical protein